MKACTLLVALSCVIAVGCLPVVDIPLPTSGDVDPRPFLERFRRQLYPSGDQFFQWWYFWLHDDATSEHWAFYYMFSDTPSSNLAYAMVCRVAHGKNFVKYANFSAAEATVRNDFDVDFGNGRFTIQVLQNGRYRIRGNFSADVSVWRTSGDVPPGDIAWDVEFDRVAGWYPQRMFEGVDRMVGVIQWNPYAHHSMVEGHISAADGTLALTHDERFRGYADMNWGINFPRPPPNTNPEDARDYAWGWYYAGKGDVSIIAGTGLTYADETFGAMEGDFMGKGGEGTWRTGGSCFVCGWTSLT